MINKFGVFSILFTLLVGSHVTAAPQVWVDKKQDQNQNTSLQNALSSTLDHRSLALDISMLSDQLDAGSTSLLAKSVKSVKSLNTATTLPEIDIPLPDGGSIRVKAERIFIMAPELAAKFPHIKVWKVTGKDDETITGVIDTTEHGFHSMLALPNGDTLFIEPDKNSDNYLSFSKHANHNLFENKFQCGIVDNNSAMGNVTQSSRLMAKSAPANIVYNLAVAATGEYTQYHGGTVGKALSAIVTTITRVNEIFQRDFGVQFRLIAEENQIIYTNPDTDPYTNDQTDLLIEENAANLSSAGVLSRSRYDIGHVFSTASFSGLAWAGSACNGDKKARGTTGLSNPVGDVFDVDFVAHELGHQLGATHTFNSACGAGQRTEATAVEPGSGSTIMSYAGLCSSNNLQQNVDAQFHAASIIQIFLYTRNGIGSQCGVEQDPSNNDPQVSAGSDYTIPSETPFMLVANGSDSDSDTLSYTWEQSDTGTVSEVDVDTGDNALIRSRPASLSKTRYIPRLGNLFEGIGVRGERLPVVDRDMHFMATVRDGKGGFDIDEMQLRISSTGRTFSVVSHGSDETLFAGDKIRVSWDVAGTNLSPVSCQSVDISFIETNGRKSHLTSTPNDGDKTLTIPHSVVEMNNARLMLSCSNNLFFNVSSGKLKIVNDGVESDKSGGGAIGVLLVLLLFPSLLRRRLGENKWACDDKKGAKP